MYIQVLVFTGVYVVRSFVVYVELCKSLVALFFWAITLHVLLQITTSHYTFVIFKMFLVCLQKA